MPYWYPTQSRVEALYRGLGDLDTQVATTYAIETQTSYLPLLDALLEKLPFVADLPLIGAEPSTFDRYSQYVTCISPALRLTLSEMLY